MTTFPNFARRENLDVLMREFTEVQLKAAEAKQQTAQARAQWEARREYQELCEDYRDLNSIMLKKLLSVNDEATSAKIRMYHSAKLVPLLQKLQVAERKMNTDVSVNSSNRDTTVVPDSMAAHSSGAVQPGVSFLQNIIQDMTTLTDKLKTDAKQPIEAAEVITG